jgi:hypothetical protein
MSVTGSALALDTNQAMAILSGSAAAVDAVSGAPEVALPVPVVGEHRYGALNSGRPAANLATVETLVAKRRVLPPTRPRPRSPRKSAPHRSASTDRSPRTTSESRQSAFGTAAAIRPHLQGAFAGSRRMCYPGAMGRPTCSLWDVLFVCETRGAPGHDSSDRSARAHKLAAGWPRAGMQGKRRSRRFFVAWAASGVFWLCVLPLFIWDVTSPNSFVATTSQWGVIEVVLWAFRLAVACLICQSILIGLRLRRAMPDDSWPGIRWARWMRVSLFSRFARINATASGEARRCLAAEFTARSRCWGELLRGTRRNAESFTWIADPWSRRFTSATSMVMMLVFWGRAAWNLNQTSQSLFSQVSVVLGVACSTGMLAGPIRFRLARRRLRARILHRCCPDCGYSLEGLPETIDLGVVGIRVGPAHCPECGSLWPLLPPPAVSAT